METAKEENIIYDAYLDMIDIVFDDERMVADVDESRNIRRLERQFGSRTVWNLIAKAATEKIRRDVSPAHCERVVVEYWDEI
jgi:hypothetical protein